MITLQNVFKSYRTSSGWHRVLDDVTLNIVSGKNVGVLGLNGAGKSTLLRLIGNLEPPDKGNIIKDVRTSWPIGFSGGFQPYLTGRENTRFIARIYGSDPFEIEERVREFAELDAYYDEPIRTYSGGMKSRLNFAVSLAIPFDCYLVDEATATGDRRFRDKYKKAFEALQNRATMIIVSHQTTTIEEFCDSAAVLHNGKLKYYEKLDAGLKAYESIGRESRAITKQSKQSRTS